MSHTTSRVRRRASKGRRKLARPVRSARSADRHELYQLAVQDPEQETQFVTRVFRNARGRLPIDLREDFCGTALSSSHWVSSHPSRTATGIDLDAGVLAWGRRHNVAPLGDARQRVRLVRSDVRAETGRRFDVCLAMNFSYFVFKTRTALVGYFRAVRRALRADGMFFLDIYGGYEAQQTLLEDRRVEDFIYEWEQSEYNPVDSSVVNHIHFRFRDGSRLRKAFSYEWRLWTPVEVHEALIDAGFAGVKIYFEDEDRDGEGTGTYRPRRRVENIAGWLAFIVAAK